MKEKGRDRVRVFHDYTDDFVESGNQDCQIPKDYVWVREDLPGRILAKIIYTLAWIFRVVYCRLWRG
ncbi:MAG: hypothetical protein LUF30_04310, partial [Lachnospiraceae bacterium]|nr:hypothetical protein [Lachnospiraceae bacterium]